MAVTTHCYSSFLGWLSKFLYQKIMTVQSFSKRLIICFHSRLEWVTWISKYYTLFPGLPALSTLNRPWVLATLGFRTYLRTHCHICNFLQEPWGIEWMPAELALQHNPAETKDGSGGSPCINAVLNIKLWALIRTFVLASSFSGTQSFFISSNPFRYLVHQWPLEDYNPLP